MSENHKINWLNIPGYKGETWNPVIGCTPISAGCKNCYAEKMAFRLAHMPFTDYYSYVLDNNGADDPDKFKFLPKWNGETHVEKSQFIKPEKWKKPRAIFVCSMGDLFHETVLFKTIEKVYDVIAQNPQHLFIVLTKRPERMMNFFIHMAGDIKESGLDSFPTRSANIFDYLAVLPNLWLGVSVENQLEANERIPILLGTPAAKRFVSCEPLLGSIDFEMRLKDSLVSSLKAYIHFEGMNEPAKMDGLDWVIVGGESGHHARPMHPNWAKSIRDQCKAAKVPFFFKQWGEWCQIFSAHAIGDNEIVLCENGKEMLMTSDDSAVVMKKRGRKNTGHLLEGAAHLNFPV